MRILQTPARFYPFVGGVERVVWCVSRELVRRGHEVTVLCAAEPRQGPGELDGIHVVRLPYAGKVANTNITPTLPLRLLRERFDVIHTHLPTPWSADWSTLLGRLRGSAVVTTYHNDIVGRGAAGVIAAGYNAGPLRLTLGLSSRIIVNSSVVSSRPGSPLRRYQHKVTVVPNGVDTDALRPCPGKRAPATIGFLSILDEFHRYKGLEVLLQAMPRVVASHPNARLVVAGSGSQVVAYRALAARLGLTQHVEFLGFVPDAELNDFYNRCSLFVLPSTDPLREGFGLVALEAMACGVPVIVSRAAGISRLIDDQKLGTVVPAGDVDMLALAIRSMLERPDQAAAWGWEGRAAVERCHSWGMVAGQIDDLYRRCIEEARR